MPPLARHTFLDPLHGSVRLTDDELKVLDHRLFRRLHNIRQNGLLYLVFPGASHSRFEHSVGVLKVATDIVEAVRINSSIAEEKTPRAVCSADDRQPGKASALTQAEHDRLRAVVRMAGLVHDLGHGPLSHSFDAFAPSSRDIHKVLEEDLPEASYLIEALPDPDSRVSHEFMSCVLFAVICSEVGISPGTAQTVASVILGRPSLAPEGCMVPLELAADIVASAPADADRMDYLMRDSRSIGVNYGLYDYNRLLKSFLAYSHSETKTLRLGIKRSGLRAVENFVQARFELFVQVYYHKTNRAVGHMLKEIARLVRERGISPFDWGSLESVIDNYLALSDDIFLRTLRGDMNRWTLPDEEVKAIARSIDERKLWKRVYQGPRSEEVADVIEEELAASRPFVDRIKPEATKDLEKGAAVLFRRDRGIYQQKSGGDWTRESAVIGALHKHEKTLMRVYIRESGGGLQEECRRMAWKVTGEAA